MYLVLAERYHWTPEQVDDLPLSVYDYLPVMWQCLAAMQDPKRPG